MRQKEQNPEPRSEADRSSDAGAESPALPSLSLPKGGGAMRSIGEKFSVNAATGTGSLTIPLPASAARHGHAPQLSLSYDSGAGNGPFGFGWSLAIPAITRKTDKGLPLYRDAEQSEVFLIAGAEDLVPVLRDDGERWEDHDTVPGFTIHRYRPRLEGMFARIERWTEHASGHAHWRSITRENVTSIYGRDGASCIFDPADPNPTKPARVFSWLVCESYDDKGNAMVYDYAAEDGAGVDASRGSERNRVRTANRYLKRICYGNRVSRLTQPDLGAMEWLFELVFDYDEAHVEPLPLDPDLDEDAQHRFVRAVAVPRLPWAMRPDPFSSYRSTFEIRTQRRCRRVMLFHRFAELGAEPCLVRSVDFEYTAATDHSFLRSATNAGYVRDETKPVVEIDGVRYVTYLARTLPPLELEYSVATIQDEVRTLDASGVENVPAGVDGSKYVFADLDGEGLPGILTEQASAWYYKPNLGDGHFGALQKVAPLPSLANLESGRQQLLDLASDGQLDLATFRLPLPGFYERTEEEGWEPFRSFRSLPNIDWEDGNLRFVDLDGDGRADVLLTDDDVFTWYPSAGEEGFGAGVKVRQPFDEERGPRVVFGDGSQSVYLADMSGDGLADLVRVRNGEVVYWPNQGYGTFGAKVTMDDAPWLDTPDEYDQRRVRLADIDGSGTTDILYIGRDGVRLYFNRSGNRWSAARRLNVFPKVDDLASITTADLFGNGTTCLVWSSPNAADAASPLRYVDLMGGNKPHLLLRTASNLGAESVIRYASSTRFHLDDERAGRPWITKLPFPVHVVERVETFDRISRNRFVTRYAYHHGFFDGQEREFRGFACVEQMDTEEFATLAESAEFPAGTNIDASSHVPPVLTKTWFHTGSRVARDLSREFYREPGMSDSDARAFLLDDTVLPGNLTLDEELEAVRALKGVTLRTETYALDGTVKQGHPYAVAEQNFGVRRVQPKGTNRHAVFLTHPRESLAYHYERVLPPDPRVAHTLTLEVDDFGNTKKSVAVSYGRRTPDMTLPTQADRDRQTRIHATYTDARVTNPIDLADDYRTPQPAESRTYEITGLTLPAGQRRFTFAQIESTVPSAAPLEYEEPPTAGVQKRLTKHARTLYRRNDLSGPLALLELQSRSLPFAAYKLAFTPGLVSQIYGTRVTNAMLEDEGRYVHTADEFGTLDAKWWSQTGRLFFSPDPAHTPVQELAYAQQHFFQPQRTRDPFHTNAISTESFVTYDTYDLLPVAARDPVGNENASQNDYRTLQPRVVTDHNGNRSAVAFDAHGMVTGSAVLGKPAPAPVQGDTLAGFVADLTPAAVAAYMNAPLASPTALLQGSTTRVIYDEFAYFRTRNTNTPQPIAVATLSRETHVSDPVPAGGLAIQHAFTYTDGFSREVQKKMQVEPDGADPRWAGSGWTIFNNKGKPVRAYEPFFTTTHQFELAVTMGVSPITFYDPIGRVAGVLHPDHTWQKSVFGAWTNETWDTSDTVLVTDPSTDADVGGFFARLPDDDYLPSWHAQRDGGALGAQEQIAARRAAVHAATPVVTHNDALGRAFLSIAQNRAKYSNTPPLDPPVATQHLRRVTYDIDNNERQVFDALGRLVMTYAYDMLGSRLRGDSMESGSRWTLNDVAGTPLRTFDTLDRMTRTEYDPMRRPVRTFLTDGGVTTLTDRVVYGEQVPNAEQFNLRGALAMRFDQAGVARNEEHDFKGNLLRTSRRIAEEYVGIVDWSGVDAAIPANATTAFNAATLETAVAARVTADTFTNRTTYDALNRPVTQISPDATVVRYGYTVGAKLETLDANLRGVLQAGAPVWTPFVTDLDYDPKGQRTRIAYGNDVETAYDYDPITFRLRRLLATGDAGNLQDLNYTYDAAGNVTHIRDAALQSIYFRNHRVDPSMSFTYDALHRLIEATGREHLGTIGGAPIPHSFDDAPRVGIDWSLNDGDAIGGYLERYLYDLAGNLSEMQHRGTDPVRPGWTRTYAYDEPNNRLSSTTVGANPVERYTYDAHGNMRRMPHLGGVHPNPNMHWDHRNQLHRIDHGGGGTVYYVYDASGQRTRKVWEKSPGLIEERIYLGGFEVFRSRNGAGVVQLERETLHLADDSGRIAIVETRTIDLAGTDPAPEQLIRYQFGNHLGSAALELDANAAILSYEEYTPYGSTAYQAVRNLTDTPKRYRYTGMERDDESGLGYHSTRYYAPWLGRWTAADPAGLVDGDNLYRYSRDNPIRFNDPSGMDPPQRYNFGDFRLTLNQHPIGDPQSHAQWGDLFFPGFVGLGFDALDLGNRVTSNPYGIGVLNTLELGATVVLFWGMQVLSHEVGGHMGAGIRQGRDPHLNFFHWFSGEAGSDAPPGAVDTPELDMIRSAGGANQQTTNSLRTADRVSLYGWLTPQDSVWMLIGQLGLPAYAIRSLIKIPTYGPGFSTTDDLVSIEQYSGSWSRRDMAVASSLTALPSIAAAFYSAINFVFFNRRRVEVPSIHFGESGRLTFPMTYTYITTGGPVLGASSVLSLGTDRPAFRLGVDVRPTDDFALGLSARTYNLRPFGGGVQVNPYVRFTAASTPGIYGGVDLSIDATRWLTISGSIEGGVNDILAEPLGLPGATTPGFSAGGGRGNLDLIFRWP